MPFVDAKETPETKVSLTNSIRGNKLYCAQAEIARKATAGVAIASLVSREARLVLGPSNDPERFMREERPRGLRRGAMHFKPSVGYREQMLSMMDRKPRAPVSLDRLASDGAERLLGEAEVDALHLEQPLVLLDPGHSWARAHRRKTQMQRIPRANAPTTGPNRGRCRGCVAASGRAAGQARHSC